MTSRRKNSKPKAAEGGQMPGWMLAAQVRLDAEEEKAKQKAVVRARNKRPMGQLSGRLSKRQAKAGRTGSGFPRQEISTAR